MSRILRTFILSVAVAVIQAHAGDQNVLIQHNDFPAPVEAPPGEAFLERFTVAFDRQVDETFADRLHPFNFMNWSIELADYGHDHLRERAASEARDAFTKSVVYGIREATVDLPILAWLEERQGLLADFLRNSLDAVGEEAVAPVEVSYRPAERSWWQRLAEDGDVHYGIRPFRTSPYAFLSFSVKDGDTLVMLANMRYYYRNFANHCFELALSMPLPHGLAVDIGTSYQFGRRVEQDGLVVKVFKEFKSGGILHVGLEARQHPAFFAGIAFPW